ncbi:hypothetical protein CC85DRAFT_286167 [Cutaneotrichosporon oleaginosum]|uniref:Uncharacterized protein n=1 Tax=Cutaneotrichosporon oleaginosum TaxID=879819 RepID=A0A0J0XKV2_9TREE|nr:uncharacterized protein CC85DRAFT_286167 [Cutaneotrichosporon oleaginosum]KLT41763.1 hypothetical protein CC85DRAFT_286167 [Cutaneotrichosporon oleaginosum]TXT12359.1 hypothetical protein COLE_02769 [Cutaneotrichosporon oleaginosum]
MDDDPWADAQSPRSGTPARPSAELRPSSEAPRLSGDARSTMSGTIDDGDLGSPSTKSSDVRNSVDTGAKNISPSPPRSPSSPTSKRDDTDDSASPFKSSTDPFADSDPYADPYSETADPFALSSTERAPSLEPFEEDDDQEFLSPMPTAAEAFGSPTRDESGEGEVMASSTKSPRASTSSPPAQPTADEDFASPSSAADFVSPPPAADDGFDDFDDFDAPAAPADFGDDEFGDFGDFGDADVAPMAAAPPAPAPAPTAPPEPRWSTLSLRPVPPRLELLQRISAVLEPLVPDHSDFTDEPPRAVGGLMQVLTSESSRDAYAQLTTAPILKPLDWTRSRVRREHLIAMGVPVNLDEVDSHRLSALPPLRITTGDLPARSQSAAPGPQKRNSLPPPAAATAGASAPASVRNSQADKYDLGPRPVLDIPRAEELCGLEEEQLALLPLSKLQALQTELEQTSATASGLLAYLLQLKDALATDSRTYNGMISELIANAAKQKAPSSGLFRRSTGPRSRPTSMSATPRRVGSPGMFSS